jgi:hypothetical protein
MTILKVYSPQPNHLPVMGSAGGVSSLSPSPFSVTNSTAVEAGLISRQIFVDSPALPSQGHRKRFLSIRHHLCSHRFFQKETRSRRGAHVFPYVWQGQEMEFSVIAATAGIAVNSDKVACNHFEKRWFLGKPALFAECSHMQHRVKCI